MQRFSQLQNQERQADAAIRQADVLERIAAALEENNQIAMLAMRVTPEQRKEFSEQLATEAAKVGDSIRSGAADKSVFGNSNTSERG